MRKRSIPTTTNTIPIVLNSIGINPTELHAVRVANDELVAALQFVLREAVAHFSGQDPLPENVLHTYMGRIWLRARKALGLPMPKGGEKQILL